MCAACFVLVFSFVDVLVRVAVTFTFAPLPKTAAFVIDNELVPTPVNPVVVVALRLIVSPAGALVLLPPIAEPAVSFVIM